MRISDWSSDVCSSDREHSGKVAGGPGCAHERGRSRSAPVAIARKPQAGFLDRPLAIDQHPAVVLDHAKHRQGIERGRSEEHTYELPTLMRISYTIFCLKKKTKNRLITKKKKIH